MATLKQDDDGDLAIEGNSFVIVGGPTEIAQRIRQRLRTFLGEYFLDKSGVGVPWFQDILKKNPNPATVASIIQNEILGTLGVIELRKFEMEIPDNKLRELSVSFSVLVYPGDVIDLIVEPTSTTQLQEAA